MLPIYEIGREFQEEELLGKLVSKVGHDKAKGAETYTFEIPEGNILLTVMSGVLHEVIYQTPKVLPWSKKKKNKFLFGSYCAEAGWNEVLDNGFGKSYRSKDGEMYALWSYAMDFNTFGTMEFHEVKW